MLLNALFPTRDIGTDPAKIREAVDGYSRYHLAGLAELLALQTAANHSSPRSSQ